MKPFLILQIRPIDKASDSEFQAILKWGGLSEDDVHRVRMEQTGIPGNIRLEDYSGVIVGGGPSNASDPPKKKNDAEQRFEPQLLRLLEDIVERDFPYLGICYGLGMLAKNQDTLVSKERYAETVGAVSITLNENAAQDPLLQGLPEEFRAFVGHKESVQTLPEGATLLASSEQCPIHMIRFGQNVYGLQFHPELDMGGMCLRVIIYKNEGYFPPEEVDFFIEQIQKEKVTVPAQILKRFVERYRRKSL